MKKIAFTLSEIMIVLMVIGILTAILLPSARNATPNQDVIMFKKGHNALHTAIRELVNSNKYYHDGDLGLKPDGTLISHSSEANRKYFCQTLVDVLQVEKADCSSNSNTAGGVAVLANCTGLDTVSAIFSNCIGQPLDEETRLNKIENLDEHCKAMVKKSDFTEEIVTNDNISYWTNTPIFTFGRVHNGQRIFSSPSTFPAVIHDSHGFDVVYKILCMDIDGVPASATKDDCVNECPFGYGIRADGKILNGARAEEWLLKSIQDKD